MHFWAVSTWDHIYGSCRTGPWGAWWCLLWHLFMGAMGRTKGAGWAQQMGGDGQGPGSVLRASLAPIPYPLLLSPLPPPSSGQATAVCRQVNEQTWKSNHQEWMMVLRAVVFKLCSFSSWHYFFFKQYMQKPHVNKVGQSHIWGQSARWGPTVLQPSPPLASEEKALCIIRLTESRLMLGWVTIFSFFFFSWLDLFFFFFSYFRLKWFSKP